MVIPTTTPPWPSTSDILSFAAGVAAWTVAIPAVQSVGSFSSANNNNNKTVAIVVGIGVAYMTTPIMSYLLGWKTPYEKVRGIALALGAAQVTDGLVHLFYPTFYSNDKDVGISCAANIFLGAGLLGIFSAHQT